MTRDEALKMITDERDESRLIGGPRLRWAKALDMAITALQAEAPEHRTEKVVWIVADYPGGGVEIRSFHEDLTRSDFTVQTERIRGAAFTPAPPAPPADLVALREAEQTIRDLRAELESAIDRDGSRVLERQHAMTTAQYYADLVARVTRWQQFRRDLDIERSATDGMNPRLRDLYALEERAKREVLAWTPPATPPAPAETP